MNNIFDRRVAEIDDASDTTPSEAIHTLASTLEAANSQPAPTSESVKRVTQELLRHGWLEESTKPDLFRQTILHERELAIALEPLDLVLRLDTHRGLSFLAVAPSLSEMSGDDGWGHPLVRRQRLTLEQSLLVAILRQSFVMHEQELGVGQQALKVAVDDLLPAFLTYFEDSGSDAKNENRLLNLLDQLKAHGIVSEVDPKQEVIVRPLIAYIANPESLSALLTVLKQQSQSAVVPQGEC
jgi:hypothetical protein